MVTKPEAIERLRLAMWRISQDLERLQGDVEAALDPIVAERFDHIQDSVDHLKEYLLEGQNATE